MPRFWTFPFFFVALVAVGCGKGEDLPKLYPVKGKVVKGGKAVKGGQVLFAPRDTQAALLIKGEVSEDGTFTLTTSKGRTSAAGAPEGKYQVTYDPPRQGSGEEKTPAKSISFTRPLILTQTFKVEPKDNQLTVDLAKAE